MELANRYSGEKDLIEKIYSFLLTINKTVKLHTLFTRAGLAKILKIINEDPSIFSFILDLTEALRCNIIDINNTNVEDKFIKEISIKLSFKLTDDNNLKHSLLPSDFNNNFVSSEDIEILIKNNIWLLPIILIRFTNIYSQTPNASSN